MKNNKQRVILVTLWVIASIICDFMLYKLKLGVLVLLLCIFMEIINLIVIWKYNPGGGNSIETVKVSKDGLIGSKGAFYMVHLVIGCIILNGLKPIWLWGVFIVVVGFCIFNRKQLKGFWLRNETSISTFLIAYCTAILIPIIMILFDLYVPIFGFTEMDVAPLVAKLVLGLVSITLAAITFPKDSIMARFVTRNYENNKLS